MTSSRNIPCHLERRAEYQGSRPSVPRQAEVDKYVTGCGNLSLPSSIIDTRTTSPSKNKIRIATINVRTLQDDMELASVIQATESLQIDVLAMQEVRRKGFDRIQFDDESIKGWQLIWSGHKRKARHGVAFLLAPHVKTEEFKEYLPARVITVMIKVKGMRLCMMNAYSPTDSSESERAKVLFYNALSKAKLESDKKPKFKQIALGDFNATISSSIKEEKHLGFTPWTQQLR